MKIFYMIVIVSICYSSLQSTHTAILDMYQEFERGEKNIDEIIQELELYRIMVCNRLGALHIRSAMVRRSDLHRLSDDDGQTIEKVVRHLKDVDACLAFCHGLKMMQFKGVNYFKALLLNSCS